jgi:Fur family peroxide stress response transcriptional regulator
MRSTLQHSGGVDIGECLSGNGLRLTAQRRHVYRILREKRDHPTAEEVFRRCKRSMPEISLATVYNCLEALVHCGLARRVDVDPVAARFCPNMAEHGHFYCRRCGGIFDVEAAPAGWREQVRLPLGFEADGWDMAVRGLCAGCVGKERNGGKRLLDSERT